MSTVANKNNGANRNVGADVTKIILSAVFVALVFIPLFKMFTLLKPESFKKVIESPQFSDALINSFTSTLIATVITVFLAFSLALCIQRTNIRFKGIFGVVFTLPMLIPSISSGMGLVILLGNNGIITKMLNLSDGIYGLWGIVIGSLMYAFPVAYLMLADVFRYEDGSPYEAAEVLGISKFRQFTAITLPYLKKPLIRVVFSIFTLIVTDYGVPMMVGGKYNTIAKIMYDDVICASDFSKGAVYGIILLIPAVAAFIIDLLNEERANSTFVTKSCKLSDGKLTKTVSYIYCTLISLLTLLPFVAFALRAFSKNYPRDLSFTFDNVTNLFTFKPQTTGFLINSILIALISATIGSVIAFVSAYMSARMKSPASKFLHLSSMTSAAIPGVVLGLSYVLTFNSAPKFIYGTIFILVMVNIVHFIASPYLMIYNSLSKINENLEGTAQSLGIDRLHLIKDVLIPQSFGTILEMFSYFFVNCMMTISAVAFLAKNVNKPISLMLNQFEAQAQFEYAAIVSLMILIVNLIIKTIVHVAKSKCSK